MNLQDKGKGKVKVKLMSEHVIKAYGKVEV